jgi:hypothetical protein
MQGVFEVAIDKVVGLAFVFPWCGQVEIERLLEKNMSSKIFASRNYSRLPSRYRRPDHSIDLKLLRSPKFNPLYLLFGLTVCSSPHWKMVSISLIIKLILDSSGIFAPT